MKEIIFSELLPFKKRWGFYCMIPAFILLGMFTAKSANFPFPEVYKNAPYIISYIIALFSQVSILSVTLLSAQVLLREQDANFQEILYSTPVKKRDHLFGRFFIIAGLSCMIFFFFVCGLMLGHSIPWINKDEIGIFNVWFYLQPFLLFAVPNTILCTAIICLAGWISKNKLLIYLSGLFIYVLYIIISIFSNSPLMATASPASDEAMIIAARIDPFGLAALFQQTKYWSASERNTQLLLLSANLLLNRVAWLLTAAVFLLAGLKYYRLKINHKKRGRREKEIIQKATMLYPFSPASTHVGTSLHSLQTIVSFIKIDLRSMVKASPLVIVCLTWIFLLAMEIFGTLDAGIRLPERFATTGLMLNVILKTIPFFCLMVILFYSNELVWRSRNARFDMLENSTAMKGSRLFIAKLISLSVIPLGIIVLSIITGIAFQLIYHYNAIDLSLYFSLFPLVGLPMICCLVIILSIQFFCSNKYAGLCIATIFVLMTNTSLGKMAGLDHPLFLIGNSYDHLYSEMSGFGNYLKPFWFELLYAASLAFVISIIAGYRSEYRGPRFLRKLMAHRSNIFLPSIGLLLFISSGSYIFYKNGIEHPVLSKTEKNVWKKEYEVFYRKYASQRQPDIVAVNTSIDLYPSEGRYEVKGTYVLQNKTMAPMDSFMVYFDKTDELLRLNTDAGILIKKDEKFGHYIFRFTQPLAPMDSFRLNFSFRYAWSGFNAHESFNAIVENGSFIRISNYFPAVGYQVSNELEDEKLRKEMQLGEGSQLAEPEAAPGDNQFIHLTMQVSTDEGQTAIGVGELLRQWQTDKRNYFQYTSSQPIPFRFAVSSAKYAIKKDSFNGRPLEIYYHPAHYENIDTLIQSAKRTMAYCEKNFSPYPFRTIRFAEISSFTKGFAGTAYPATIFMTEHMIFHTNTAKSKTANVISDLSAHELAHQWWGGNQLQPAYKKGRAVLTETLAMYTELMLNKKVVGREEFLDIIKMYKGFYFSERVFSDETALFKANPGAPFLNYYKGLVVMYQVQLLLGEEKVNIALRNLLWKHAYPLAPASSLDLVNELHAVSNVHQHRYIDELFKEIVTHDIKINKASANAVAGNQYELNIEATVLKYNEVEGKKILLKETDSVDILISGNREEVLLKYPVINNKLSEKILLPFKPQKIILDPFIKLMDAFDEDNSQIIL